MCYIWMEEIYGLTSKAHPEREWKKRVLVDTDDNSNYSGCTQQQNSDTGGMEQELALQDEVFKLIECR